MLRGLGDVLRDAGFSAEDASLVPVCLVEQVSSVYVTGALGVPTALRRRQIAEMRSPGSPLDEPASATVDRKIALLRSGLEQLQANDASKI